MKTFQQLRPRPRRIAVVKSAPGETNRTALQEALGYPVQAKLKVGSPDDVLEREADAVADRVMATPEASAERESDTREEERMSPEPEEEVQRQLAEITPLRREHQVAEAPESVERTLGGTGKPLEPALRQDLEQRFGQGFAQVRVHAGAAAGQSATEVQARAYTAGTNIVFAAGEYAPHTQAGRRLLAHELAHVVQQSATAGPVSRPAPLRRHVTHDSRGTIGGATEFLADREPQGRYLFTHRGGWIDRQHMRPHAEQANQLMRELEARRRTIRVSSQDFSTRYTMDYARIPPPIDAAKLEQVAVAIMFDHDYRFESYQASEVMSAVAQSPFSHEDLPSDRIGVEIGLRYRRLARAAGLDPDVDLNAPANRAQADLLRRATREVVTELGPASASQAYAMYAQFLRNQGRDPTSRWDQYVASYPTHRGSTPYRDPVLSPVTTPAPFLAATSPTWAFQAAGIDASVAARAAQDRVRRMQERMRMRYHRRM
ncbi:MAG: DUF4157 domain-containing protein [Pseudomonadota bacterium]|nr:DUF4157 domain-containing protein [Pseudomonadota bacterium]